MKWPAPTTVKEVQQFLGVINYHRAHIKKFSEISRPLFAIIKKDADFEWETDQKVAFETLKTALTSSPVLAFPRINDEPFILDTDASEAAIGAELLQVQDGEERVISYGSYALTPSQRNYCVTRKELLAIVRFTRQFRHYLLGQRFYVRTDHSSLTWLLSFKNPSGLLARWLEELSQYDMVIQYRKGRTHSNADGQSRIPDTVPFCKFYVSDCKPSELPCGGCHFCLKAHKEWSRFEEDVDDVVPLVVRQISQVGNRATSVPSSTESVVESNDIFSDGIPIPFIRQVAVSDEELDGVSMESSYSSQETREMQLGDSDIHDLLVWKEEGVEPTQAMLHLSSPAVRNFWQNKALLEVRDGVLFYRWVEESGERSLLVVPHQLKQEVMRLSHDLKLSGHPGMQRTLHRLRQRHIWHKMNKDCKLYVLSCKECNRQKKASVKPRGELGMFHAGAPVERLHIDILGPFPQSVAGNRYILMLVCQFTKWLEAYPLPEQTAEQTARVVVDHFISRFGVPEQIHTDQGRNFTSKLFEGICKLLEITKTRTTPYRPCSNGQVERYNRTILQLIRCHLQSSLRWDEDLPLLTSAIRSVPNRQTGFTPNMLMLGREVRHPADLLFGVETAEVTSMPEFVTKMQERFRRIHDLVREKLKTSQVRQKKVYDQHLRQATYQVGDVVYRRNDVSKKGQSKKLAAAWKGPFLIQEVLTPVLFRVQGRKKASVLHHDLLKSCHDREIPVWIKRARHALEKSSKSAPIKEVKENALRGLKNLFKEQDSVTPVTEPGDQSDEGFNGNGVIEGSISTPIDIGDDTDPLSFTWVQCENPHCLKWRKISSSAAHALTDDPWYCNLNEDLRHNTCGAEEESSEQWEQDLEDQGLDFTIDHHAPSDSVPSASAVPSLVDTASFVSDRTRHGRATRRPVRYQD